jgi:hypothetical protein
LSDTGVVGRTADHTPSSDAEIFFTSIFGLSAVLLAGELLFRILIRSADGLLGPSLLARTAPLSSVRPLYAFFVLLPMGLAFLAIGVPFFFRTVRAALRGRLLGPARHALLAIPACALAAVAEVRMGGSGLAAVLAVAAVAAWQAHRTMARFGARHGFALLALAGGTLAGLAWYESAAVAGKEPSIAIAPTLLVAPLFCTTIGLSTAAASALQPRGRGRFVVAVCSLATAAWLCIPLLRAHLAESSAAGDQLELTSTIGAATALVAFGLLQRMRA